MKVRSFWPVVLGVILAVVLLVTSMGIASMSATAPGATSPVSSGPTALATIVAGSFSNATAISSAFWGVNVAVTQRFNGADATSVAATPVTYVRFPGGTLGEEFNYTSGTLTAVDGSQKATRTTTADFVTSCKQFNCEAIMQLPAEIDRPATAADYASYVVKTLKYQPAYWEIGNDPSGWTHFGVPWSEWKTEKGGNTTPAPFANLVHAYITAILAVDPAAKFIALGAGAGKNYQEGWVKELAIVDGHLLSGISVHSYIQGNGPSNPTDAELFANLNGFYSLPAQITADRSYIKAACPSCTNLDVFVSEINAAEDNSYDNLLPTFAGTLYLAAETVQGLALHETNLDWFAYDSHFSGSWSTGPKKWQMQYYLFSDIMPQLKTKTLSTTVTGPSTFYGIATYDSTGLSLLLVNVNTTKAVEIDPALVGFILGRSGVTEDSWQDGAKLPTTSSVTLSSSLKVPPLSIVVLTVGSAGTKSPGQAAVAASAFALAGSAGPVPGANAAGSPFVASPVGVDRPVLVPTVDPVRPSGPAEIRATIRPLAP
ncbi:MAG: hypothetical protein WA688_02095 [Thermoplasmata archaeon]